MSNRSTAEDIVVIAGGVIKVVFFLALAFAVNLFFADLLSSSIPSFTNGHSNPGNWACMGVLVFIEYAVAAGRAYMRSGK